jgi:hypothetical protein
MYINVQPRTIENNSERSEIAPVILHPYKAVLSSANAELIYFYDRRQNAEERRTVRSCDDDGSYYPGRLAHRLTSRPTRQVATIQAG